MLEAKNPITEKYKMNEIDTQICETQRAIYDYMSNKLYRMKDFSNAFLNSEFCRRALDTPCSRFQLEKPEVCAEFFMPEIQPGLRKFHSPDKFAGHVGFTYRMLYILTSIPSAELCKIITYQDMRWWCFEYFIKHYDNEKIAAGFIEKFNLPLHYYRKPL